MKIQNPDFEIKIRILKSKSRFPNRKHPERLTFVESYLKKFKEAEDYPSFAFSDFFTHRVVGGRRRISSNFHCSLWSVSLPGNIVFALLQGWAWVPLPKRMIALCGKLTAEKWVRTLCLGPTRRLVINLYTRLGDSDRVAGRLGGEGGPASRSQ